MIGDIEDIELEIAQKKAEEEQKKNFLSLFNGLEKEKILAEEIYKEYGKIIKIRRIYVRKKGDRNAYYQMTYEADKNDKDNYGVW